jgi:hypothetical protein
MELGGECAEDPGHHDAIQSSPIDGWIDDIGEDMVVKGVVTKCEKHEVAPPLVVRWRVFQNDHGYRSYILEADSLRMQVHDEGSIRVGANIGGAIVTIVPGDHDPLDSGELLFQVTGDGLSLLSSEGGGALAHPCLVQGVACDSHDSSGSLSHGRDVVLLPLGSGDLLPIDGGEVGVATRHGRQDGGG